jgi:hypothetical protein
MPGPKVEATDDATGNADVERYEALRRDALGGEGAGSRLGLALLQRRGVAAWARAWNDTPPLSSPARRAGPGVEAPVAGDELVGVLATMAMACLAGR